MKTRAEGRAEVRRGKKERISAMLKTLVKKPLWRGDPVITKERRIAQTGLVARKVVR